MKSKNKNTGFAIAIAWPETYCKQPGAWYDALTLKLGVNQNNYYKVGHAALVLIDSQNLKVHYFDFGRYHAPYQHGRVRSAETDHDLEINTIPLLTSDGLMLENFRNILYELQNNPACHGEGALYASYCSVNFERAYAKARHMQKISPIPYGPFQRKGSNCSRFVNTAILAGKPAFRISFNLKYKVLFTPTPLNNVNGLNNILVLPKSLKGEPFFPIKKLDKQLLFSTLPKPDRHHDIPDGAQWLSGEGAGSWFVCSVENTLLQVTRYSPQGAIECKGLFENQNALEILKGVDAFTITHPSNCAQVCIRLNNSEWQFNRTF
jgi:hypothetical protein